jgi:hypothetical protein
MSIVGHLFVAIHLPSVAKILKWVILPLTISLQTKFKYEVAVYRIRLVADVQ